MLSFKRVKFLVLIYRYLSYWMHFSKEFEIQNFAELVTITDQEEHHAK